VVIFLETERLVLLQFTDADTDLLFELNSDPDVMRYLTGGEPTPREEVADRIIPAFLGYYERFDGMGFWAAQDKAAGEFLGWFHFRPGLDGEPQDEAELGYRLRKTAWGKGYATEGSRALIEHGFAKLGLPRVFAHTMTVNLASRRVMEKAGLTYVRAFVSDRLPAIPGADQGEVEYALTRQDWQAGRADT
jgi:RimJ/RimL family protein N-acetyltransferase